MLRTTLMNFENFMLSEKSHSQKTVKFRLYEIPILGKPIKTESRLVVACG